MFRETVAKMSIQNYREIFASLCDGSLSKYNDSVHPIVFELENWK